MNPSNNSLSKVVPKGGQHWRASRGQILGYSKQSRLFFNDEAYISPLSHECWQPLSPEGSLEGDEGRGALESVQTRDLRILEEYTPLSHGEAYLSPSNHESQQQFALEGGPERWAALESVQRPNSRIFETVRPLSHDEAYISEVELALESLVGHYKEMDKLMCELIPWPGGIDVQVDRHQRLGLAGIEYFIKGPDASSLELSTFRYAEVARLDMENATASLQQIKEIYHNRDRTDAVIRFLALSKKVSLHPSACQQANSHQQASCCIHQWEKSINEYVKGVQRALASIETHSPRDPTKSWATALSFTSPNNSPHSMPLVRDNDSIESNLRTYISKSPGFPHISVSVHSTATNEWETLDALQDTGASGDWISKHFLCGLLMMEMDELSDAERHSERIFSFGGHPVHPLGKKKLTWYARNGMNGRRSGPARRGQERTTTFYVAPELRQDTPSSHMDRSDLQPAVVFGKETLRATGAIACRPILALIKDKGKEKTAEQKRVNAEKLRQREQKRKELASRDYAESSAREQHSSEDETSEDERDQSARRNNSKEPPPKCRKRPKKNK